MTDHTTAAQAAMQQEFATSAREWAMQRGTVENFPATARAHIRNLADALLSKLRAPVADEQEHLNRVVRIACQIPGSSGDKTAQLYNELRAALASAPVAGEPAFYINPMIIDAETGKIARDVSGAITWDSKKGRAWSMPVYINPRPESAPVESENSAHMAGLETSINILSALVDQQRLLLVQVEDVCGRDGHGGQLEDGESDLIDRVRQHLAATTTAAQAAASAPVAGEAQITNTQAADFADKHGMYYDMDQAIAGNHARALLAAYAAPQASEAVPLTPDWANYQQGWADGLAEGNEALDIARSALMEIADLADVEADQRGVIVNAALTRINEITSRAALSAQPGAQKDGGAVYG
jgi:hypothetical protein